MAESVLTSVAAVTAALVPVHQGLVEVYKASSGAKLRRYFEALAEVLYGAEYAATDDTEQLKWRERFVGMERLVPAKLGARTRREWVQGVERRLIESFMQRGVGDSPTPDISEQDIENVARVIREKKPADVREAARHLRVLAARGAATGADAAEVFASIEASDEIKAQLARWAKALRALKSGSAVNAQIETYYQAFVEQHLPEEHAARIALPNALKSAELRYHHDLLGFSKILAVVEGLAIAWWVASGSFGARAFVGVAAAAGLFVLSQGSKGLLDAIVGLGSRLRTQS